MKIILTAFRGKLKSEPMDWPENQPPRIRMVLDMPRMQPNFQARQLNESGMKTLKAGTFESTGRHFVINGGHETAEEYVLVEI